MSQYYQFNLGPNHWYTFDGDHLARFYVRFAKNFR